MATTKTDAKKNGKPQADATATLSLRDRIKVAAASSSAEGEKFEVEGWGTTVELRSLSVGAKNRLVAQRDASDGPLEGRLDAFVAKVLIETCYDPETSEQVWSDEDAEWLIDQDAAVVEPLLLKALEKSGITEAEILEALESGKDAS